jgi:4-hydroxy-tetrahydrodipicolinate synthase
MRPGHYPRGVLVPACTPFHSDLSVDPDLFVSHCKWLLDEGANGLAVFGTTSEANSLGMAERTMLLERVIAGGISPRVLMPGTGCCALPDAIALTRHAVQAGCMGVLLLPPFYFKGIGDDGLFAFVSELIQRIGDARLRIYLHHLPPMAGIGWSLPLIERLLAAHPGTLAGIKDSSGDWNGTKRLLHSFPGFEVFPGSEPHLLDALRLGGAGCISATANINVRAMRELIDAWQLPEAAAMQQQLSTLRATVQKFPLVAANKAVLAQMHYLPEWNVVRPPLMALAHDAARQLAAALKALHFELDSPLVVD